MYAIGTSKCDTLSCSKLSKMCLCLIENCTLMHSFSCNVLFFSTSSGDQEGPSAVGDRVQTDCSQVCCGRPALTRRNTRQSNLQEAVLKKPLHPYFQLTQGKHTHVHTHTHTIDTHTRARAHIRARTVVLYTMCLFGLLLAKCLVFGKICAN